MGIRCVVDGHKVHIGNRRCLQNNPITVRPSTMDAMEFLERQGQTAIVVSVDGRTEAVLGLIDKAKDEAALTVAVLKGAMHIKVHMLTGDNSLTASVVAQEIGIEAGNVTADVLPSGKVECIKRLQDAGECVAFVGDGVNDAPALVQADLGVAIGAGADVAIEAANVVLVNSNLRDVVTALDLSRAIYRRIKLNFVWALGYNSLAIPVAAGVLYPVLFKALPPFMAALAMALSSVSVLTSSLLLNRYRPPVLEKKYGRALRSGKLGLEEVVVTSSDGMQQVVTVACASMSAGGPCSCAPEVCECSPCAEHGNPGPREAGEKTARAAATEVAHYPGCRQRWGKPCACAGNCRCVGCSEDCSPSSAGASTALPAGGDAPASLCCGAAPSEGA